MKQVKLKYYYVSSTLVPPLDAEGVLSAINQRIQVGSMIWSGIPSNLVNMMRAVQFSMEENSSGRLHLSRTEKAVAAQICISVERIIVVRWHSSIQWETSIISILTFPRCRGTNSIYFRLSQLLELLVTNSLTEIKFPLISLFLSHLQRGSLVKLSDKMNSTYERLRIFHIL